MKDANTIGSGKDLLILADHIELNSIDRELLKNSDRLALSPGAMLAFENSNLAYSTFNDLYDYRNFRSNYPVLIKETEELFSLWDKKYEPFFGFPHSFSGNIHWFLILFSDIHYLSAVCQKIKEHYKNIYLAGEEVYEGDFKFNVDFSSQGLILSDNILGLKNKARLLAFVLSAKQIFCNKIKHETPCSYLLMKRMRLNFLINKFLEKAISKSKLILSGLRYTKKETIFCIQGGWDVYRLRNYLADFKFVYPTKEFETDFLKIKRVHGDEVALQAQFGKELNDFAKKWFPDLEDYIHGLFNLYHSKVLACIADVRAILTQKFDSYRPKALLYGIGATSLIEDLFAFFANERNIPVFYFQHGGTMAFTTNYQYKYIEHNDHIKKINIFHSRIEKDLLKKTDSSEIEAFGSSNFYNIFLNYSKHKFDKKRILYCSSLFNSHTYKSLMFVAPDIIQHKMRKDMMDLVARLDLKMDIKVHIAEEDISYDYFANLLNRYRGKDIRILRGTYAEKLIKNCDLLIVDCVATTLIPEGVFLNIPVIVYLQDLSTINQETFSDFKKIFYLVQNEADLAELLNLYKAGKLKSKFSLEMVDKYVFPIKEGDPAVKISDYIQNKIR